MTEYVGYALKRISFYPDRGRVAEYWEPSTGRWREEEGRVEGLVVGYCPRSCVISERSKIPRNVGGTIMEVCISKKPEPEESKPPQVGKL
jgi:hypothetical protein